LFIILRGERQREEENFKAFCLPKYWKKKREMSLIEVGI
jgi:hypothetical protein